MDVGVANRERAEELCMRSDIQRKQKHGALWPTVLMMGLQLVEISHQMPLAKLLITEPLSVRKRFVMRCNVNKCNRCGVMSEWLRS